MAEGAISHLVGEVDEVLKGYEAIVKFGRNGCAPIDLSGDGEDGFVELFEAGFNGFDFAFEEGLRVLVFGDLVESHLLGPVRDAETIGEAESGFFIGAGLDDGGVDPDSGSDEEGENSEGGQDSLEREFFQKSPLFM